MTLFWALTGASYHMTFTSMVHINRDRQHVTRCARVNRLRAGRNAIENHKWLSDKSRVVLVRNKCTKSPSSSFPATGTRRSTWPSPSSHASQRSHRKKNFSFVWMSRTAIWERCQDALLPLLSCQTRMYVRLPRHPDVVTRNESTPPACSTGRVSSLRVRVELWSCSPEITRDTLAVVPARFPRPVYTITS